MSDTRPGLPDPQQDRHVAFPDLGADSVAPGDRSTSSAGSPPPAAAGPVLPPDAWARRDPLPPASPPRQTAQPPILHQPSTSPPRTPRRRWIPTLAIIGIFIAMGHANDHGGTGMHAPDGSYSQQEWSGSDPDDVYDPSTDGWVTVTSDPVSATLVAPAMKASPVPSGTTVLRVEVVSMSPESVTVQVTNDSGLYDEVTSAATPLGREVHVGNSSNRLDVMVRGDSSGATDLQCRLYAGKTLVALSTGPVEVSCSATW